MSENKPKLLYVYEERIPESLRKLILDYFLEEFEIETMTYKLPDSDKCAKMNWAELVLFAPGRHLSEKVFESASHIKLMQLWSSGYDKFNTSAAEKYNIPVANNGGANAISVAEHTLLLMLAVNKWLPDSHRRVVEGQWTGNSHGMDMFLLHGKVLGVVGFGNIGRAVAQRAAGFGMRVVYYDPVRASSQIENQLGVEYCDFPDLLSTSDVITLHLHLDESTRGIISKPEFILMKNSAILINVSRAQLVDNEQLYIALQTKRLRGVGLDVYYQEPTSPDDPLLNHPNVVGTPHMAGSTNDAYITAMQNCLDNLRRAYKDKKPRWVVNNVV